MPFISIQSDNSQETLNSVSLAIHSHGFDIFLKKKTPEMPPTFETFRCARQEVSSLEAPLWLLDSEIKTDGGNY